MNNSEELEDLSKLFYTPSFLLFASIFQLIPFGFVLLMMILYRRERKKREKLSQSFMNAEKEEYLSDEKFPFDFFFFFPSFWCWIVGEKLYPSLVDCSSPETKFIIHFSLFASTSFLWPFLAFSVNFHRFRRGGKTKRILGKGSSMNDFRLSTHHLLNRRYLLHNILLNNHSSWFSDLLFMRFKFRKSADVRESGNKRSLTSILF